MTSRRTASSVNGWYLPAPISGVKVTNLLRAIGNLLTLAAIRRALSLAFMAHTEENTVRNSTRPSPKPALEHAATTVRPPKLCPWRRESGPTYRRPPPDAFFVVLRGRASSAPKDRYSPSPPPPSEGEVRQWPAGQCRTIGQPRGLRRPRGSARRDRIVTREGQTGMWRARRDSEPAIHGVTSENSPDLNSSFRPTIRR